MAEEQVPESTTEPAEPPGLDMDEAVANIAESLYLEEQPAAAADEEPSEQAAEPAAPAAEPAEKLDGEKAPANVDTLPTSNVDTPPDTWRKEAKEAWATVPPVVREEMRKRESDIAGYVERVRQPAAVGEHLTKLIEPYLGLYEKTGVDPWANIQAMLVAQERLLLGTPEQKLAMFQAMANQAGIKLEGGQLVPEADAQAHYIHNLEQRIASLEGGVKQVTSTFQQARVSELEEGVKAFASDKEAHPFFYECADRITHFIRTGAVSTLEEGYQLAVQADPVLRQKELDKAVARATAAKATAEKERVEKARKAGKVAVRSTPRKGVEQLSESLDETLKRTLADIHSRPH